MGLGDEPGLAFNGKEAQTVPANPSLPLFLAFVPVRVPRPVCDPVQSGVYPPKVARSVVQGV